MRKIEAVRHRDFVRAAVPILRELVDLFRLLKLFGLIAFDMTTCRLGHQPPKDVLDVDHAARIVEIFAIQRNARYACLIERAQQFRQRLVFIERNDIGARHHDGSHAARAEPQQPLEHLAFGFGKRRRWIGCLQRAFDGIAQCLRTTESQLNAHRLQPPLRALQPLLFGCGDRRIGGRLVVRLVGHGLITRKSSITPLASQARPYTGSQYQVWQEC